MLYKLRIRVVMQNRYLVIVLGVRLLLQSAVALKSRRAASRWLNELSEHFMPCPLEQEMKWWSFIG